MSEPKPVGCWVARPNAQQNVGSSYAAFRNGDNPNALDVFVSMDGGPARLFWGAAAPDEVATYMVQRIDKGWFIAVDDLGSDAAQRWRQEISCPT